MDRPVYCGDSPVPRVEGAWLGTTTIGSRADTDLLAYVARSEATIYVDPASLGRVAGALKARVEGAHLLISKGRPLSAGQGIVLRCAMRPLEALPMDALEDVGDGRVLQDRICWFVEPGDCCHVHRTDGSFAYSFKAPSYGMSCCRLSPGNVCKSWLAEEDCETFTGPLCAPGPPVNRTVTAWVCSLL